jgi:hypothetical protein
MNLSQTYDDRGEDRMSFSKSCAVSGAASALSRSACSRL